MFLQQDRHVAEGFLSPAGDPDWNEIRQYVTYVTPGWGISMDKTVFEETCNRSKTQLAFIVWNLRNNDSEYLEDSIETETKSDSNNEK